MCNRKPLKKRRRKKEKRYTVHQKITSLIDFILRYSRLSSRLIALLSHVILNERLWFFTASFQYVFNIRQHSVLSSAVWLLYTRWRHVKLLPTRRTFCEHHTTMHQFTVSLDSFEDTYVGCVCIWLQHAICTFGRMTGIFYVLLR